MSIRLMTLIWDSDWKLTPSEKLVLLCLADHANDDGLCWPSIPRLAQRSGISDRQAKRCIAELAAQGRVEILEKGNGRGHSTYYRVATPKGDILSERVTSCPIKGDKVSPESSIEPSIESIAVVADAPASKVKLDPQTKAMLSTILFGTPKPAPLQQNHVNIAKVWRGMQDMGAALSEVLQWYNEAWPQDWRGKSGQHPTPTQLLNGVAAWRAEVEVAAPQYREELVLLEEDDDE